MARPKRQNLGQLWSVEIQASQGRVSMSITPRGEGSAVVSRPICSPWLSCMIRPPQQPGLPQRQFGLNGVSNPNPRHNPHIVDRRRRVKHHPLDSDRREPRRDQRAICASPRGFRSAPSPSRPRPIRLSNRALVTDAIKLGNSHHWLPSEAWPASLRCASGPPIPHSTPSLHFPRADLRPKPRLSLP